MDEYNQKFWDYYLQVLPFRRVPKKMQLEKYRAGLNMKIQTQVNTQHFKDIQSLMHAATMASLVQMEDPTTLMSLQAGLSKKRKFEAGRFQKRSEAGGEKRMMPYQKPRGGRFRKPFRDFKGKAQWTPEQIEIFRKEGKCFRCGKEGHVVA